MKDIFFKLFNYFSGVTEKPRFAEPIPNVTVAVGRDATLPCVVANLGDYQVRFKKKISLINKNFFSSYSNGINFYH